MTVGFGVRRQQRNFERIPFLSGVMYATGRGGLKQDMEKAAALFESAASHARFRSCNVPQAQTALAMYLYEESGTERDVAHAFRLFQQTADKWKSRGTTTSGLLFWRGEGTEKNVANAFTYLEAAA